MLPPTDRRELFALKKGSKMAELLEVKNLSVSFDTPDGEAEAVRDVSFFVKKGKRWRSWASPAAEKAFCAGLL